MSVGAVASTTAKVGLAMAGVGVGAWSLSRALDNQTSPGDTGGYAGRPTPGSSTPYVPPYDRPTSGGDTGGHGYPSYPSYPTNPGGYVPSNPGGYVPADPFDPIPHDPYIDPYVPVDPYAPYVPAEPGGYVPTWPTYPGGSSMWSAVSNAAPFSWSSTDISRVTGAAQAAGRSTWDAADMVRQIYNSTPYSWSGRQEAQVAATALLTGRAAYDTGRLIDHVEWATPLHWSANSDVRLAVAALRGGVPTSQVGDIIRSADRFGSSQSSAVAQAEAMLLAGGRLGDRYPLPGYPGGGTSTGDTYGY